MAGGKPPAKKGLAALCGMCFSPPVTQDDAEWRGARQPSRKAALAEQAAGVASKPAPKPETATETITVQALPANTVSFSEAEAAAAAEALPEAAPQQEAAEAVDVVPCESGAAQAPTLLRAVVEHCSPQAAGVQASSPVSKTRSPTPQASSNTAPPASARPAVTSRASSAAAPAPLMSARSYSARSAAARSAVPPLPLHSARNPVRTSSSRSSTTAFPAPTPAVVTSENSATGGSKKPQALPRSPSKLPARSSLKAPAPVAVRAALRNLTAAQLPSTADADLNVIRAAAVHSKESLQLPAVVPAVVRSMRAPRLETVRAAITTLTELFDIYGDALCETVADDSSATSSGLLALMQKATGADLNSKRVAPDANAALITMVESVSPVVCIGMLENYCIKDKVQQGVRAKAAALVTAAAYRLAVTDVGAFDTEVMAKLLRMVEPLLGSSVSCRQAAKKLAVVIYSAWGNQPQRQDALAARDSEEPWAALLRLNVEPHTAEEIAGVIVEYGDAGQELVASSDLHGFSMGHPVGDVVSRLVLAADTI